ncbi:MAG TPA: hypothetical protein VH763_06625 [Gemmatimonadales bacterium]
MTRARVLKATLLIAGALGYAATAQAQTTIGADAYLYSAYVWRGLSLTNKPVLQPDVYVTIPAGQASFTAGGWFSFDLGKYDDLDDDISESGGLSAFNLAEFDWWGEVSYPVGKATLTGGATGYIYPNKLDDQSATFVPTPGLLTKDNNTIEIYGKIAVDVPLSPKLALWYDVDKIKGLYGEFSVSHTLQASEKVGVNLGALLGFNAGQSVPSSGDDLANFADDGITHLDLSAGVPLTAGAFSITPAAHLVINSDDFTKFTSPSEEHDVKFWGGVTISWSKALGEAPPEEGEEQPAPTEEKPAEEKPQQ